VTHREAKNKLLFLMSVNSNSQTKEALAIAIEDMDKREGQSAIHRGFHRFCPECSAMVGDNAKFCEQCGQKLL